MGGQLQRYKERLKDKNAKKAQKVSPLKKGTEASPDAEDMESGEAGL
jgi:hypothetical protein